MEGAISRRRTLNWWWIITTAGLVAVWLLFAWVHLERWLDAGEPVGLGLLIQETVTAALFIMRRPARGTSRSWLAWVAATLGTFSMLAARPAYDPLGGLEPLYVAMQLISAGAAIMGLWSLGGSFGLVAANRGVKTRGVYRFVRHPIYASYVIGYAAYVLENPTWYNLLVVLFTIAFQVVRIAKEEEFLSRDPEYCTYKASVRYRLVPFLY